MYTEVFRFKFHSAWIGTLLLGIATVIFCGWPPERLCRNTGKCTTPFSSAQYQRHWLGFVLRPQQRDRFALHATTVSHRHREQVGRHLFVNISQLVCSVLTGQTKDTTLVLAYFVWVSILILTQAVRGLFEETILDFWMFSQIWISFQFEFSFGLSISTLFSLCFIACAVARVWHAHRKSDRLKCCQKTTPCGFAKQRFRCSFD